MRPAPTEAAQSGRAMRIAHHLYGLGPLVGLIVLCITGTLLNHDFATVDNLMNVLTRTSFIGIIAVGETFVIISGASICRSVRWPH
jgi:ribose transport system permease protein